MHKKRRRKFSVIYLDSEAIYNTNTSNMNIKKK